MGMPDPWLQAEALEALTTKVAELEARIASLEGAKPAAPVPTAAPVTPSTPTQ